MPLKNFIGKQFCLIDARCNLNGLFIIQIHSQFYIIHDFASRRKIYNSTFFEMIDNSFCNDRPFMNHNETLLLTFFNIETIKKIINKGIS